MSGAGRTPPYPQRRIAGTLRGVDFLAEPYWGQFAFDLLALLALIVIVMLWSPGR